MESFREKVETHLLRIANVRAIEPSVAPLIEAAKDGTFGLSYLGFLLYCHGQSLRGWSPTRPNGLVYADGANTFGIGIFRREGENDGGHLLVNAPRGHDALAATEAFLEKVRRCPQRPSRAYIRFLDRALFARFIQSGYEPVAEQPWHPHASAEDETFHFSRVELDRIRPESGKEGPVPRNRRLRDGCRRFQNFLVRNGVRLQASGYDAPTAKTIVKEHFLTLEKKGKRIGSTAKDYESLLDADLDHPGRFGLVLKAARENQTLPVSVFVGEKTDATTLALYCSISRREYAAWQAALSLPDGPTGFSAMGTYIHWNVFNHIRKRFPEITHVQLGGSETADLDAFKRRMGAQPEPTYWVVKTL